MITQALFTVKHFLKKTIQKQLFSHAAEKGKTRRKLACREVLSFSDIGRLAHIEDLAAHAAVSSVSCANPKCMVESMSFSLE